MRTSPNRLLRLVAAVALVGLLASCSDDKDDPPASSTTSTGAEGTSTTTTVDHGGDIAKPCELLTPAELQDAFDSTWDEGSPTHQDQTGAEQCVWSNTDAPPVKTFSLTVYTDDGLAATFHMTAKEFVASNRGALAVDEELDLADEAFRAGTTVYLLDGSTAYSLSTFLGDSPEAITGLKALAAKVIAG